MLGKLHRENNRTNECVKPLNSKPNVVQVYVYLMIDSRSLNYCDERKLSSQKKAINRLREESVVSGNRAGSRL